MDPGSGIRNRFFFGSQSHIFDSSMTNFWVKSTLILNVLAKEIFFTCLKKKLFTILRYMGLQRMEGQKNIFLPPLFVLLLYSGSGIDRNQYPGSAITSQIRNTDCDHQKHTATVHSFIMQLTAGMRLDSAIVCGCSKTSFSK
jgi:hypothetical protein